MTLKVTTLAGTFGLALLLLGLGSAAHADVTNPADNPNKITVKGDDGQTYVDGQDTLPGFDDEECTYIPGAWFDFDKNRVYYADGQSIPWTEWDRATGYKDWLAKKGTETGGSGGTTTGTTTDTTTTGTKTTGTKTTGTKTTGTKTTATKTTGTKTTATVTTTKTTDKGPSVTASPEASQVTSSASPSATSIAVPSASADAATPGPSTSAAAVVAAGPESGASAGPGAGIAILGGLAVVGGLAYGVNWFVRRRPERGLA